jgi:hypothetical protein
MGLHITTECSSRQPASHLNPPLRLRRNRLNLLFKTRLPKQRRRHHHQQPTNPHLISLTRAAIDGDH